MYGSLVDLNLEARMILMWGAYPVPFLIHQPGNLHAPLRLLACMCKNRGNLFFFSAAILFAMYPHAKTM